MFKKVYKLTLEGYIMQIFTNFIQCLDDQGKTGDFLGYYKDNKRVIVSPTFLNLIDLFTWCKNNGYKPDGYGFTK